MATNQTEHFSISAIKIKYKILRDEALNALEDLRNANAVDAYDELFSINTFLYKTIDFFTFLGQIEFKILFQSSKKEFIERVLNFLDTWINNTGNEEFLDNLLLDNEKDGIRTAALMAKTSIKEVQISDLRLIHCISSRS